MESTDIPQAMPDLDRSTPGFEKLHNIPAIYYKQWLEKHGGKLDGADVLDFGSGEGLVSVGLSTYCGAKSVRGVDICRDFERVEAALHEVGENLIVPSNVVFEQVEPGASIGSELYDVIVSWSVLEHVEQEIFDHQMQVLSDALRPGGLGIFQMAPLFYSPYGSHLFGAHEPWRHLTMQHNLLERQIKSAYSDPAFAEAAWNCYVTLNKFTAENFIDRISRNGFDILDRYTTYVDDEPDENLLSIFGREVLTKNQLLLVCRKRSA